MKLILDTPATAPDEWRTQDGGRVTGWPDGYLVRTCPDGVVVMATREEVAQVPPGGSIVASVVKGQGGPGDYLSSCEAQVYALARKVYKERLDFGVAPEQAAKDLPVCLTSYKEERDRLAADAQRWTMIRDTVIRLDAQARPGLPMGDDDIEGLVLQILEHAAKKSGRTHSSSALPGGAS